MSFFVTLPSNASMDIYKNNTISNYTTQLHIPIRLNIPYEVALVEFLYDNRYEVKLGNIQYHVEKFKKVIDIEFTWIRGDNFKMAIDNFNKKLYDSYIKLFIEQSHSIDDYGDESKKPKLTIDENTNIVKFQLSENGPKDFFYFYGFENRYLNHIYDDFSKIKTIFEFNDSIKPISSTFFIYTDIIKYQYIGDTWAPILRTVHVPNNVEIEQQSVVYDSPHYLPLNSTNIDTINIRITDEQGENIRFKRGKSLVKLHFRPIKYGF